ncbi:MAG: ABC transporter substrate-binding protein [Clostridiaceae bacterium]
MKKKILRLISISIVTLMISILSVGCNKENGKKQSSQNTERTVVDGNGRTVTIPNQVDRVAVGGAFNQIVLMLGGADKIVATAEAVQTGFFAKVYPKIKDIPAAYTGSGAGTVNMETLLKAQPQVVFGTFNESDSDTLKSANISMVGVVLNKPEDIKNTISIVGKVLGTKAEEKANEFIKYYDDNLNYVREKTKSAPKVKVFVASGDGAKGSVNTIAGNDINTSYLETAGATNIVAEKFPTASSNTSVAVDFEFLFQQQPDVIIATSKATYDYIIDANNGSQWQKLSAIKNKKVYLNPKGVYLWSVRSAEGALQPLWLGKILHPDLFNDLDIKQKVKEFYKNYYYYDATDEDIEEIMNPTK